MSLLSVEDITAAHKANVEMLMSLTGKALESVERLVELNLQVARSALGDTAENVKAALSAKDARELMTLQAGLLQPAAEKAAAYSRHLYDIMTATRAEVGKVAAEQMTDAQAKLLSAMETAVKNAPAGTESAVAMMKSALAAASSAYEGVQQAVKQAGDIADANFQELSSNAAKTMQSAQQTAQSGQSKVKRVA